MTHSSEYLYLEFPSGHKRKEYLYRYGTDEEPTIDMVRLTFRGEQPHTIRVPNQVASNEYLINRMADEAPDAQVIYIYFGEDV